MNADAQLLETHYTWLIRFLKDYKTSQESNTPEVFNQQYLSDYEPEYRVTLSHGYESVNVNIAFNGPNVWLDTNKNWHEFNTAWMSEPLSDALPDCLVNYIDNYYAERLYNYFGIEAKNIGSIEYDSEDVQHSIDLYEESLARVVPETQQTM